MRPTDAGELSSDGASSDAEDLAADDLAAEARKKAGLPELELDALPSTIAIKMMMLGFN